MTELEKTLKVTDKIKVRFNDLSLACALAVEEGIEDPLDLEKKIYEVVYISKECPCGCGSKFVAIKSDVGNALTDCIQYYTERVAISDRILQNKPVDAVAGILEFFRGCKDLEAKYLWLNDEIEAIEVVEVC